jgi:tight adherence protein B
VCETLLVAHELGGEIDAGSALAEERIGCQGRGDAHLKPGAVRPAVRVVRAARHGARRMSVGDGRAAYGTAMGQVLVLVGIGVVVVCWVWASRIMRLPSEERVFDR